MGIHTNNWPAKHDLFGISVSATCYEEVVAKVIAAARRREGGLVDFMDTSNLMTATADERHRTVLNGFDVVAPDGQPVRWALNYFHRAGLGERVYGPESTLRVCGAAAEQGISIYLFGGRPEVIEPLKKNLLQMFPKLKIAGAESPPFRPLTEQEDKEAIDRINNSGADILLLGLGAPKQEGFAYDHRHSIKPVQLCVGAAFDLHAGVRSMAPQWMQRNGMEWVFRLYQEPGRLWKRYFFRNARYLMYFAREALLRGRKRSAEPVRLAHPRADLA
jgi:N-acetylglucosaminyldiphosphoundecaprenol N-acetyl-beta-D-mannosaminyltransferase